MILEYSTLILRPNRTNEISSRRVEEIGQKIEYSFGWGRLRGRSNEFGVRLSSDPRLITLTLCFRLSVDTYIYMYIALVDSHRHTLAWRVAAAPSSLSFGSLTVFISQPLCHRLSWILRAFSSLFTSHRRAREHRPCRLSTPSRAQWHKNAHLHVFHRFCMYYEILQREEISSRTEYQRESIITLSTSSSGTKYSYTYIYISYV